MILTAIILSVCAGCGIGVLRYVLNDKWNVLPKRLCQFCATFWAAVISSCVLCLLFRQEAYLLDSLSLILSVSVATVAGCVSYVYIKNASL